MELPENQGHGGAATRLTRGGDLGQQALNVLVPSSRLWDCSCGSCRPPQPDTGRRSQMRWLPPCIRSAATHRIVTYEPSVGTVLVSPSPGVAHTGSWAPLLSGEVWFQSRDHGRAVRVFR